jgi:hypothetical protein
MNTTMVSRSIQHLLCLAALLLGSQALAGPAAYTERNANVQFGYAFNAGSFGLAVGVEIPIEIGFPIDFSVAGELSYRGGVGLTLTAKELLLPSLGGNPPIAVAVIQDLSLFDTGNGVGWRLRLGPVASFDWNPLVVSLAPLIGFGSGGFAFDLGLGARYYFDPFALEVSFESSNFAAFSLSFGLRYLF